MANRLQKRANCLTQLRTVAALQLGSSALKTFPVKKGLPWNDFAKVYDLELGIHERVIVAQRTGGLSYEVVFVYQCQNLTKKHLALLQQTQHRSFVTVHDVYHERNSWYIVTESMAHSLQAAVGNPFLDSSMVAAIMGQVVTAMVHLEDKGLRVGSLTCSDVLLHPTGQVKLSRQWDYVYSDSKDDVRRLGSVMMELMNGCVKDNGSVEPDDPARWSQEALKFLGMTTSASSARELLKLRGEGRNFKVLRLSYRGDLATNGKLLKRVEADLEYDTFYLEKHNKEPLPLR